MQHDRDIMTDKGHNIDLLKVIGDFLALGHVENIVAMFRQDSSLYDLAGDLVMDERYAVRLGTAVLFEELSVKHPNATALALPSLLPLLQGKSAIMRGEAATILGIIGTPAARQALLPLMDDPDPQVREIVADIMNQKTGKP